jgi:hypothetical protein
LQTAHVGYHCCTIRDNFGALPLIFLKVVYPCKHGQNLPRGRFLRKRSWNRNKDFSPAMRGLLDGRTATHRIWGTAVIS